MTSYVDFFIPPSHYHVLIDLGGKFSRDSTVVFQGFEGAHAEYVNMRRVMDSRGHRDTISSNAVAGPGHGHSIRVTQQIQALSSLRIVCTRLAPGDQIHLAVSSSGTTNFELGDGLHAILNSRTNVLDLEAPGKLFSPYRINEEPDLVDYLQVSDDI